MQQGFSFSVEAQTRRRPPQPRSRTTARSASLAKRLSQSASSGLIIWRHSGGVSAMKAMVW